MFGGSSPDTIGGLEVFAARFLEAQGSVPDGGLESLPDNTQKLNASFVPPACSHFNKLL
mgnify:CR=1 FL=1